MNGWGCWLLAAALCLPGLPEAHAFEAESVHQKHCVACHARITGGDGTVLYRKQGGLVRDLDQLGRRVDHCRRGAGLDWPEAQVRAMRDYLDARHYGFSRAE